MKRATFLATTLLMAGLQSVLAQKQTKDVFIYRTEEGSQVTQTVGEQGFRYGVRMTVTGPDANVLFMGNEFSFEGWPVKGAPYSAESSSETVQTLADGNRIVRKSSSKVYRDGEGRTRRESDGPGLPAGPLSFHVAGPEGAAGGVIGGQAAGAIGEPTMIHAQILINDPVAGVNYVLDPDTRTAQMMSAATVSAQDPSIAAAVAKARQEMAATGKGLVTIKEPGKTVVINMQQAEGEGGNLAPSNESIGTRTIDGVECEGTRTTVTIPAGRIGNDLPIVISSERWYSPKLQVVVLSKRHDPRFGDTTYKLVNVDQSEPPASLFQVPADYSVVDLGEKMKHAIKEKGTPRN